jgi:hypothetical protein
MIIQQCDICNKKGKSVYCDSCTKVADYFDVYAYIDRHSMNMKLVGTIKAYTWHQSLEYIKDTFFTDYEKKDLTINCEKEFAFVEKYNPMISNKKQRIADNDNKDDDIVSDEVLMGYKIYLSKESKINEHLMAEGKNNFRDLTIPAKETAATMVEPTAINKITPITPTMITRSTSTIPKNISTEKTNDVTEMNI